MGIHGLSKLLGDYAPASVKENDIKSYFGKAESPSSPLFPSSSSLLTPLPLLLLLFFYLVGRKVAIDASMSLYQFLIAVRQDGQQLTNASGETTR